MMVHFFCRAATAKTLSNTTKHIAPEHEIEQRDTTEEVPPEVLPNDEVLVHEAAH